MLRAQVEEAHSSGWVDQPGDSLNLLTFSARTPTCVRSTWSCQPTREVRSKHWEVGPSTCLVSGSQTPIRTCLIFCINKNRCAGSLIYGDRYFVYGKIHPIFRAQAVWIMLFSVLRTSHVGFELQMYGIYLVNTTVCTRSDHAVQLPGQTVGEGMIPTRSWKYKLVAQYSCTNITR